MGNYGESENHQVAEINGECPTCHGQTINGVPFESCELGEEACIECGKKECNEGC